MKEDFLQIGKLELKKGHILVVKANTSCLMDSIRQRIYQIVRETLDQAGLDNPIIVTDNSFTLSVIGEFNEENVEEQEALLRSLQTSQEGLGCQMEC